MNLLNAFVSMSVALTFAATDSAYMRPSDGWQNGKNCGVNALMWSLQLLGVSASYDDVCRHFPVAGENGHSFSEVVNAARSLGVCAHARRIESYTAMRLSPPFIVHLSEGELHTGHFMVVDRIVKRENGVILSMLDGTNGRRFDMSPARFDSLFSGFVVTFDTTSQLLLQMLGTLLIWGVVLILAIWFIDHHYQHIAALETQSDGLADVTTAARFESVNKMQIARGVTEQSMSASGRSLLGRLSPGSVVMLLFGYGNIYSCAVFTMVSIGAVPCFAQSSSSDLNLDQIATQITESKQRFFQSNGGIRFQSNLAAKSDPYSTFAFEGDVKIDTGILWPKLFIAGNGVVKSDQSKSHRVSVYDFVEHKTVGYGDGAGIIIPNRHLFSGGYSFLFKYLHWAEGFQKFRYGEKNESLNSVPECFSSGKYHVAGEKELDGQKCILIEDDGHDRIWIAIDQGYLVHRRETKNLDSDTFKEVTQVKAYNQPCTSLTMPTGILVEQYYGKEAAPEKQGKLRLISELDISKVECGQVNASLFQIDFPDGIRITDLEHDKTWYNGRQIDEVVPKPSGSKGWWIVIINVIAVLIVGGIIAQKILDQAQINMATSNDTQIA